MAADDDEVGELQLAAEQLHVDGCARLDDLRVPADRDEAVGAAERGHAARALAHRIGGERRPPCSPRSTRPTSRYSVRPISQLTFTASRARHRRSRSSGRGRPSARITGATNSWNVKIAEVGKPGRTTTGSPPGRRQADRLARLERDAVRDDAGIGQLGDDAIRQVAGALARAAGEQHDVGLGERLGRSAPRSAAASSRDDAQPHAARRPARATASARTCALES